MWSEQKIVMPKLLQTGKYAYIYLSTYVYAYVLTEKIKSGVCSRYKQIVKI